MLMSVNFFARDGNGSMNDLDWIEIPWSHLKALVAFDPPVESSSVEDPFVEEEHIRTRHNYSCTGIIYKSELSQSAPSKGTWLTVNLFT